MKVLALFAQTPHVFVRPDNSTKRKIYAIAVNKTNTYNYYEVGERFARTPLRFITALMT